MATPLDLLDALKERLGEILHNFPTKLANSTPKKMNIYRHKVPERLNNRVQVRGKEETQNDVFPFCVVKIDSGGKSANVSNEDIQVNLFIGVENEGHEGEGYDDVLLCIQSIWNNLNENPVVGNFFRLKYEIDWALNDNDAETHPYYYGLLQLIFETQSMQFTGGYESGERSY